MWIYSKGDTFISGPDIAVGQKRLRSTLCFASRHFQLQVNLLPFFLPCAAFCLSNAEARNHHNKRRWPLYVSYRPIIIHGFTGNGSGTSGTAANAFIIIIVLYGKWPGLHPSSKGPRAEKCKFFFVYYSGDSWTVPKLYGKFNRNAVRVNNPLPVSLKCSNSITGLDEIVL